MPLTQLPQSTIKLIGSTQVISSVSSVVKELMENALDAGASNINIKLEKHGLDKIEIKDDGCGISRSDTAVMCLPYYTSKITDFNDLNNLNSYGFRGEALSSLCAVSQVSITTKTVEDEVGMCYSLDTNGQVISAKVSTILKGTIVTVTDLFKCLPVRKQLMSSSRRSSEELKKVENIVKSLAVIHPKLRVTLTHNKFLIWQKISVSNLLQSVRQILPQSVVKQLHYLQDISDLMKIELLVPKQECDIESVFTCSSTESNFVYINARPIRDKKIEKTVCKNILQYFGCYAPNNKYPIFLGSLTLPQENLDVNLEPNKTKVFIQNQNEVLELLDCMLSEYYRKSSETEHVQDKQKPTKKFKPAVDLEIIDLNSFNLESKEKNDNDNVKENQFHKSPNSNQSQENISQNQKIYQEETKKPILNIKKSKIDDFLSCKKIKLVESQCNTLKIDHRLSPLNKDFVDLDRANFKDQTTDFEEQKSLDKSNEMFKQISQLDFSQNELQREDFLSSTLIADGLESKNQKFQQETINYVSQSESPGVEFLSDPLVVDGLECKKSNEYEENNTEIKHDEYKGCKEIAAENITLSQWSRGYIGSNYDPIKIVTDERKSENQDSKVFNCNVIDRSVSSQMGQREMAGFTKFAREVRSKILEETPGLNFIKVAGELSNKWKNLHDKEKRKYEELASKVEKDRKQQKMQNNPSKKIQQTTLQSCRNPRFQKPSLELGLNINDIRRMCSNINLTHTTDKFGLIHQIQSSHLWVFYDGTNIKIVDSYRLREVVTFYKYLAELKIPHKLNEYPQVISSKDLDPDLWSLLINLENKNNVISDPRITHNGFIIELSSDADDKFVLTHIPLNIDYYGVDDLCEVLKLIKNSEITSSIFDCRPNKVRNFLRSEAFRDCCLKEMVSDTSEMKELLFYWLQNILPYSDVCIHDYSVSIILDSISSET